MAKEKNTIRNAHSPVALVEERAQKMAESMGLELVEVTLQKESRGKCLCIYVDKEGGFSLDDCEMYHKALQPQLEDIDYDIMEVSSPGIDRPIKTQRDFERNRGAVVDVKLFAAMNGEKMFRGALEAFSDIEVSIQMDDDTIKTFDRKAVASVKPVIELDEEDFADVEFSEENAEEAEF